MKSDRIAHREYLKNIGDIFRRKQAEDAVELAIIRQWMIDDLDEDGNNILEKYPYVVVLEAGVSFMSKCDNGMLDWLDENVGSNFKRIWVTKIYFKNAEDAILFKLTWS